MKEGYLALGPCEVLTEGTGISGGLTTGMDSVGVTEANLIHADGTEKTQASMEASKLAEPLQSKATPLGMAVIHGVHDYPCISTEWYENHDVRSHIREEEWSYIEVSISVGHWSSEWSSYDSHQCWEELWELWVEGGERTHLGCEPDCIEEFEDKRVGPTLSKIWGRWPRLWSSLQWRFY